MSTINKTNWNKIYKTETPKLIAICRRYVKDVHIAEDIVQESIIKAINKLDSFKGDGSLNAWLRKIVINEALMFLRKNNNNPIELSSELPNLELEEEISEINWTISELLTAIDSLPVNYRSVFNLYALDGYKHKEIAEILNISENTSKSQLMRARINLQAKLEIMAKENQKKRNSAGFILLGNSTAIDEIFRKGLKHHSINPSSNFIINNSSFSGSVVQNTFKITNKILITTSSIICILFAILLIIRSDKSKQIEDNQQCITKIAKENPNFQFPNISSEIYSITNNTNSKNKLYKTATIPNFSINALNNNNNFETILKSKEMKLSKSLGATLIATSIFITNTLAQPIENEQKNKQDESKKEQNNSKYFKSNIKPAKYKTTAQVAFIYPIGSAGTQSIETKSKFSFNVLSGVIHTVNGFELGGISNINKGHIEGVQISGIFNQTSGHSYGLQIGGIYNWTSEYVRGMQLAGIFNYANCDMKGLQLSGIFNYTGQKMNGMQLSFANYTKNHNGFQLGFINIADSIGNKNASLGFINIFKHGGYREFELISSDFLLAGLSFKLGSKRLYTIYSAGYNNVEDAQVALGVGIGTIIEVSKKFWIQPEAYTYTYSKSINSLYDNKSIQSNRMKLGLRYNINKHFAFTASPSIACNLYKSDSANISRFNTIKTWENNQNPTVDLSLGASLGFVYYW